LKKSLCSKEARDVLSGNNQFKTKKISFKYSPSSRLGIAFSVRRQMGGAVLRNRFKRKARALFLGGLFNSLSINILVHPLYKLNRNPSLLDDFILFKKHLINTKIND